MHVRSCRRLFPTDKRSPVHCSSCTDFAKYIDYHVIFLLVCFGEWRLWTWIILLDCWSIFIKEIITLKKSQSGVLPLLGNSCSVVDCCRHCSCCWLYLCQVTKLLYDIVIFFPNGRAIIGFSHGLSWCVETWPLGLRSPQNPRVLWWPEAQEPCISHITTSHDSNL